jgi:hypothetical protein
MARRPWLMATRSLHSELTEERMLRQLLAQPDQLLRQHATALLLDLLDAQRMIGRMQRRLDRLTGMPTLHCPAAPAPRQIRLPQAWPQLRRYSRWAASTLGGRFRSAQRTE